MIKSSQEVFLPIAIDQFSGAGTEGGGQGGHWPPQYFADQLTLFQPWGADSAHPLLVAPPMFFTFRHHSLSRLSSSVAFLTL